MIQVLPPRRPLLPILVVEDDATTRDGVQSLLELEGFRVEVAQDGDEALRRLRQGLRPCLILLDLAMPAMDGFEFRKEQIADPRLSQIPTVAYSAIYDVQPESERLYGAPFLRKPVEFDTLLLCIEAQCLKD